LYFYDTVILILRINQCCNCIALCARLVLSGCYVSWRDKN